MRRVVCNVELLQWNINKLRCLSLPSSRPKEGLFQAQTSRYLSEFEELVRLGKGSYGNVFTVLKHFLLHAPQKKEIELNSSTQSSSFLISSP